MALQRADEELVRAEIVWLLLSLQTLQGRIKSCSPKPLFPGSHMPLWSSLSQLAQAWPNPPVGLVQAEVVPAAVLQAPGPVVHRPPLPRPGHPPALKHRPYTRPDR